MTTNATDNSKGMGKYFFRASAQDFSKIPGSPVAYSAPMAILELFQKTKIADLFETRLGMATANNDLFLRFWYEISINNTNLEAENRNDAKTSLKKWFPYQKGGNYRKWSGNNEYLVNWLDDGREIRSFIDPKTGRIRSHNYNLEYIFKTGVTWNALTSSKTSARISEYSLFDNAGSSLFLKNNINEQIESVIALINSKVLEKVFPLISPTLNYQPGDLSKMPAFFPKEIAVPIYEKTRELIAIGKTDWDSYETSWDFTSLPLLQPNYRQTTLEATYQTLRTHWQENTLEMQRLEEENNRIFIEAYGLEDELTPDVPLEEITLTCNPHYRYHLGKAWDDKSEEERTTELETRLQQDTVQEFISYAVGCMFGRYSLDKEGLVLANQGETLEDYLAQVPNPSFMPDEDNVIPMLDGDWFTDDVVERFKVFLKITFGEEHYETNLAFIEKALNVKGTRNYSIRDYFLKEFYNDHVRTYKKRPIYWLFSSPKGSFNALVYMHRYRPDTVSVVLNGYLREYQTKLKSHKQNLEAISIGGGSQAEKTRALKEIERINKVLHELEEYERDVVYPLATEQVSIDLDDGVKQNYPKLGKALKKITGL